MAFRELNSTIYSTETWVKKETTQKKQTFHIEKSERKSILNLKRL